MPFEEGRCLKCGRPLLIKVPGKNIGFCPDCKAEMLEKYKKAGAEKGKDVKNKIFHDPPTIKG